MFAIIAPLVIACFFSPGHAKPLGPHSGPAAALTPTLPDLVPTNSSDLAFRIRYTCSDDYGPGVALHDCENALSLISPKRAEITFAERDDPAKPPDAVPLPWRLMGGV